MRQWMKNWFWSMVLWADEVWVRRGRTRETREDALEEALAVCSARTVVLCAMHALHGVSPDDLVVVEKHKAVLEQWRG